MVHVFEIMVFEHLTGNSLNYDENTRDRQSRSYQTVLKIQMRLREMFSSSIFQWLLGN